MKRSIWITMVVVLLAAAGTFLKMGPAMAAASPAENTGNPIAKVKTVPLTRGTIQEQIFVYGQVVPAPGALQTVSVSFESKILTIGVNNGQKVAKGDTLLKLEPSPAAQLELDRARRAYDLEKENFKQVENQYKLKLATNQQLLQARQSMDQAKLTLESLEKRGVDGVREIRANVSGLVKQVNAEEGAIVSAGSTLVEIVAQNRLQVLLGVEPENIRSVQTGQEVVLTRINAPTEERASGKIREISYAVNPSTRLVDIFITLDSTDSYLLNESIAGQLTVGSAEGFIVPRSAVLPEGDTHVLYTVKDNRAVRHTVTIGLENPREYQVSGSDLRAGQPVVVEGNYELTDNMRVNMTGAAE